MPGFENTTAAQEKRETAARTKLEAENVARAIEKEPLPSPAELREGALKRLLAIIHAPSSGRDQRDALEAARVILKATRGAPDPSADLLRGLEDGTIDPVRARTWLVQQLAKVDARLAARGASGEPSADGSEGRGT